MTDVGNEKREILAKWVGFEPPIPIPAGEYKIMYTAGETQPYFMNEDTCGTITAEEMSRSGTWRCPDGSLQSDPPDFTDLTALFKWCVPKLPNGTEINIIYWDGSNGVGSKFLQEPEMDWYYGASYGCELNVCRDKEYGGGGYLPGEALREAILSWMGDNGQG